jgi:hypothetical protein
MANAQYIQEISETFIGEAIEDLQKEIPLAFLVTLQPQLVKHTYDLLMQYTDLSLPDSQVEKRLYDLLGVMYPDVLRKVRRTYSEKGAN